MSIQSKRVNIVLRKVSLRKAKSFKETTIVNCPATNKIVENFKRLEVLSPENLNYATIRVLEGVKFGITNAKRKNKSGRANYRLTGQHSKDARKRVTVDGEWLVSPDACALHPYLLASFIDDPKEKERWLKLCEEDIYLYFSGGDPSKRDLYKSHFQRAMSAKGKRIIARTIRDTIKRDFPNLYSWIEAQLTQGITVQSQLQQLEAKIFIDGAFLSAPY